MKIKIGLIFGGMSTENEVSVMSANSIFQNFDKTKYEVYPIYISKKGDWYRYLAQEYIEIDENLRSTEKIGNIIEYLQELDVLFPVLHGLYGEDGTIQGLFELLKKPYVGCGVLASSIGMDKAYTKIIFDRANIAQAPYIYLKKCKDGYTYVDKEFNEKKMQVEKAVDIIEKEIGFPAFVKPSNSGSSVGINKAKTREELKEAIQYAGKFDNKILVEKGIQGKEVECAVLGNEDVKASCVGEIKSADEFYSYDAKYQNEDSRTIIPAEIDEETSNEIRKLAVKAFKAIDGKGLSRVDFFVEDKTNKVYINEINTLPGFTKISMYPKLFEAVGIPYSTLLDKLIETVWDR